MSQISLTASMRSNLLSLQGTSQLMSQTQERLSTGKKVNSAIDNPSAYYTAQSLSNRAGDLNGLLDSMGQAISTIKATNEGIEAITSFVEQAKAVATSAVDTTDAKARTDYSDQFNSIINQIDKLAKDSGYKGINLLQEDKLTVIFNEARDNKLEIEGVDADSQGLGLSEQDWDLANNDGVKTAKQNRDDAIADYDAVKARGIEKSAFGTEGFNASTGVVTVEGGLEEGAKVFFNDKYYVIKTGGVAKDAVLTTNATECTLSGDGKYYESATEAGAYAAIGTAETAYENALKAGEREITSSIQTAIEKATAAVNTLRTHASYFGNNYSIVQTRQNFTENLINVLEEGADKLVLADMNEESANMLALQTRQQLAINSLSLASQAAQSVLRLFS